MVFTRAGYPELLDAAPDEMVDEAVPAALFRALWQVLPAESARRVAVEAGRRTADYVIANRIPAAARLALRLAPRALGARLLLRAIERNAWTFAGSGRCETAARPTYAISIADNPLRMPGCVWHRAVFARLFDRLTAPGAAVVHAACGGTGGACRFEIHLPTSRERPWTPS